MSKHICLVILLNLGFVLMPGISFACTKKTTKIEQGYCSKDRSSKTDHKNICNDKSCKKCKDVHDCSGKCKHNSCRCSNFLSSIGIQIPIDLKMSSLFSLAKKQKFSFKQAYYCSGYSSIWQPPKIS